MGASFSDGFKQELVPMGRSYPNQAADLALGQNRTSPNRPQAA